MNDPFDGLYGALEVGYQPRSDDEAYESERDRDLERVPADVRTKEFVASYPGHDETKWEDADESMVPQQDEPVGWGSHGVGERY